MNNQELETKVKELLDIENFFDMIIAVKEFEKEYKGSDFYKTTKIPLLDVIKNTKIWYGINFKTITAQIQKMINSLDMSHLNTLINQLGDTFAAENADVLSTAELFKDLLK